MANLYTLDGEPRADEVELPQLSGYRDSAPVRIGNGAIHQLQLDVYGELLDSAYLYARFGGASAARCGASCALSSISPSTAGSCPTRPSGKRAAVDEHYTYSKMMCWVAVDRGLRIARALPLCPMTLRGGARRGAPSTAPSPRAGTRRAGSFTQALDSRRRSTPPCCA